jgi:hypothetical protein
MDSIDRPRFPEICERLEAWARTLTNPTARKQEE